MDDSSRIKYFEIQFLQDFYGFTKGEIVPFLDGRCCYPDGRDSNKYESADEFLARNYKIKARKVTNNQEQPDKVKPLESVLDFLRMVKADWESQLKEYQTRENSFGIALMGNRIEGITQVIEKIKEELK